MLDTRSNVRPVTGTLAGLAALVGLAAACASAQPGPSGQADGGIGPDAKIEIILDAAPPPDAGPMCGDSDVQGPSENCDDGNANTETCDYGLISCMVCDADCHLVLGATARCGDDHLDPDDEACDDGNTVTEGCAYGLASCTVCNSACQLVAGVPSNCGDNVVQGPAENCDDGNAVTEACAYGDPSCTVCNGACRTQAGATSLCGDGSRDVAHEGCDDGNTAREACSYGAQTCQVCGSVCQLTGGVTSFCGDGDIDASNGEECEDLNAAAADGCTPGCRSETFEHEPNEDGAVSTGGLGIAGNDFGIAGAIANGTYDVAGGQAHLVGALFPAGDEDVFALTSSGVSRIVTLETFGVDGYGTCATGTDTGIHARDAAGVSLGSDDDSGPGLCSRLVFQIPAGQTIYFHVVEFGDNASIGRYFLVVSP